MTASYSFRVTFRFIFFCLSWQIKHLGTDTTTILPHLLFLFFFFQKELGMKVEIFERKVESYKKLTPQLGDTIEYIKVRSSP